MNSKKMMAALLASSMMVGALPTQLVYANETAVYAQKEVVGGIVTGAFNIIDTDVFPAYAEAFQVKGIQSYTNNGGKYASSTIDKAFDGNKATHWETGKPNSSTHINEIVVTFDQVEEINRVIYAPRQDASYKGFATQFSIYSSMSEEGNDFELVGKGSAARTGAYSEFKFEATSFKRLKFVFDEAYNSWASASELMFFKEDTLPEKVESLFTNGLMNELNPKYASLEVLTQLETEANEHPLHKDLLASINLAKQIIENPASIASQRIITGEQRGAYGKEMSDRYINGNAYSSFESYGRYVTAGEEFVVYVDADENGVLPQLCLGQSGRNKGEWRRFINLRPGKNVIKAPTDINPSAIYLVNNASADQQTYAPRMRVEGGTAFPVYYHGETDPQAFYNELVAYSKNIDFADEAFTNGNPTNKVFNMAEFVSENTVITTSAMGAIAGLNDAAKQGYDIGDTMDSWEEMYEMFQGFLGFEEGATEKKHSEFPNKFVARVFSNVPLGYAAHGFTGYRGSDNVERDGTFYKLIAMPIYANGNDNWCYNHEFGHIFNTKHIVHGEVTNNLFAQEYRRIKGLGGDRADWNGILKRFKGEEVVLGYWTNLAILSQLNIGYGYDAYAKASTALRDNVEVISAISGSSTRRLAVAYSLGLGVNLLDFFEGWEYTDVTPEMEALVSHLPKETRKIEYLHNGAYDYKGTGFSENVQVEVKTSVDEAAATNTLSFTIDAANSTDLLGYEILKDGEVIGFTRDSKFIINDIDVNSNTAYEVIAYAKNLTTAAPVLVNSCAPTLEVVESISLKLNETFDPAEYVSGKSYAGVPLESINATHNVDPSKKGTYEVNYTLTDQGVTVQKTMIVNVVSNYDYLSDSVWTSVTTQYGSPRRNNSILGRINGEIKTFSKGFGIHANGEIVYDLGEHEYETFEALVGVDMNLAAQENSSIQFKITVDGETLATTKVLKHVDNMVYVSVPVTGAKELKIEVLNGGNGNTSDHAVIANPKLITQNCKPELTVEKDVAIKLGESLKDIYGTYSATDIEDGDLTDKVTVSGEVNLKRSGKYTLTYTVVDSHGNKTAKERMIFVVDMIDTTYVSDANWASANSGWGGIKKDASPSGNTIRLTDENFAEVIFQKGLGAHAKSTITYDLETVDASYFSSFVGIDRAMYNSVGSVSFEVYLDGKKVADTGIMKAKDPMKYIEVNLAGTKELKLVATDGGNGIGSDHAVWGDAKFHFANPDNIPADRSSLEDYLKEVDAVEGYSYTAASWTNFQEAKANAKAVLEIERVKQEQLDEVQSALQMAKEALAVSEGKMALKAALSGANDVMSQEAYEAAPSWDELVTLEEEMTMLYKAVTVDAEEALLEMASSLQGKVDEIRSWLKAQKPKVDKTALEEVVASAKALDLRMFTKDSKVGFAETLSEVEAVVSNEEASQEEIDAATSKLEEAVSVLQMSEGKVQLQAVLELAATKVESDYLDSEMWDAFAYCYEFYMDVYEKDYTEQNLYIAHVYFASVIEDLEKTHI